MIDLRSSRAANVFHITVAILLLCAGVALTVASFHIYLTEAMSLRTGSISVLPNGGSRLPDPLANELGHTPWGAAAPTGLSLLVAVFAIAALISLQSITCCGCANARAVRIVYGVLMVAILGMLVVVAAISFLIRAREPQMERAWFRKVREDPRAICRFEKEKSCRGFRDLGCVKEKCADCSRVNTPPAEVVPDMTGPNCHDSSCEVASCFLGYNAAPGSVLVSGVISLVFSLVVSLDLFVLAFCSFETREGDASPSNLEEQK